MAKDPKYTQMVMEEIKSLNLLFESTEAMVG
jgi:hypothetical protein